MRAGVPSAFVLLWRDDLPSSLRSGVKVISTRDEVFATSHALQDLEKRVVHEKRYLASAGSRGGVVSSATYTPVTQHFQVSGTVVN